MKFAYVELWKTNGRFSDTRDIPVCHDQMVDTWKEVSVRQAFGLAIVTGQWRKHRFFRCVSVNSQGEEIDVEIYDLDRFRLRLRFWWNKNFHWSEDFSATWGEYK